MQLVGFKVADEAEKILFKKPTKQEIKCTWLRKTM